MIAIHYCHITVIHRFCVYIQFPWVNGFDTCRQVKYSLEMILKYQRNRNIMQPAEYVFGIVVLFSKLFLIITSNLVTLFTI